MSTVWITSLPPELAAAVDVRWGFVSRLAAEQGAILLVATTVVSVALLSLVVVRRGLAGPLGRTGGAGADSTVQFGPPASHRARPPAAKRITLASVLRVSRSAFIILFLVSGVINVLMLTGSIYMMQVYDRVLGSQSVPTLIALSGIAIAAYALQGLLEYLRARVLALIGERFDAEIGAGLITVVAELPLRQSNEVLGDGGVDRGLANFRHLDAIRGFLSGPGPSALFDLPWMPIYVAAAFLLHPWLGWLIIGGGVFSLLLTLLAEWRSKTPTRLAIESVSERNSLTEAIVRAAEAVRAMGMLPDLTQLWSTVHGRTMAAQRRQTFSANALAVVARTFRTILQSTVLGLGAYLAIKGQMSSGALIAASILASRALAPVDMAIGSWRGFVAARHGYARLGQVLKLFPEPPKLFALPPPSKSLDVDNIFVAAPGAAGSPAKIVVRRAKFRLEAGQALGIVGASASGKSSLARGIIGLWPLHAGSVQLDNASIAQWSPADLGRAIGYLPQDVQLIDGTIGDNVARFQPDADPADIIAAAEAAAFHDHIKALGGYDVRIGRGGTHLSAGQRQRLGLTRALYKRPFLVVLDEPNANLDQEGEAAVVKAIQAVKAWNGIAIVIAHRPQAIAAVDFLLLMHEGDVIAFGPRDEVLKKFVLNAQQINRQPPKPN